ncbi:MAG: YjgN family protein [Roseateles sp.]
MHDTSLFGPSSQNPARYFRVEFTGSGSEYFRIWIVNLLLIVLTLGLYLPFAKARRLRYFYSNTLINGQALSFHGDPWKMFRGFVLLALLMGSYALAGQLSALAGALAFLILCAIWPALWRAGLQFRLAHTSWRGLRMRFEGHLAGAYLAFAPLYLPALLMLLVGTIWADALQEGPAEFAAPQALMLAALGLGVVLLPLSVYLIKRYQHGHYAMAAQHSHLKAGPGDFYRLALKALGLLLLCLALFAGLATLSMGLRSFWLFGLLVLGFYLGLGLLIGPYLAARLQNLVWNRTRSEELRFDSDLSARALTRLSLKNWLLTVLTLGLYRPFAAVHTARLRLEAVRVRVQGELDAWVAEQSLQQPDAAGEAAGDFFGIDMGL